MLLSLRSIAPSKVGFQFQNNEREQQHDPENKFKTSQHEVNCVA